MASAEAPPELAEEADITVEGPEGWLALLDGAGGLAMPYTDLLRVTVLLTGAEATALAAITAVATNRESDTTTLIVAAAWWLIALVVGLYLGRPEPRRRRPPRRPRRGSHRDLPAARVPGPHRLRPPLADRPDRSDRAGALGVFFPGVAAIGAGYALLVSLAWHNREAAVLAIEQRDGVKFYVVPNSALRPIQLVRTPGLRSSRTA